MAPTGGKEPDFAAVPDAEKGSSSLDFRLRARRTRISSAGSPLAWSPHATPRKRLLKALEMEQRGFLEEAVVQLRSLHKEIGGGDDSRLGISVHYFLALFLALRGEVAEAREIAEDGILLAWEHSAQDELELLDMLVRELPDREGR